MKKVIFLSVILCFAPAAFASSDVCTPFTKDALKLLKLHFNGKGTDVKNVEVSVFPNQDLVPDWAPKELTNSTKYSAQAGGKYSLEILESTSNSSHKEAFLTYGSNALIPGHDLTIDVALNAECKITEVKNIDTFEGYFGEIGFKTSTCKKIKTDFASKDKDATLKDQQARAKKLTQRDVYHFVPHMDIGGGKNEFESDEDHLTVVRFCDQFADVMADE
jgi:hypothetical protein